MYRSEADLPWQHSYNNPANWTTILGTSNKLSFCIVESNTPTCKHQYSMLDLRTSEQMAYLNTNLNFWNSTDADLQSILTTGATTYNHKIIYNQLSDFPNLALGKYNYSCKGMEHRAAFATVMAMCMEPKRPVILLTYLVTWQKDNTI